MKLPSWGAIWIAAASAAALGQEPDPSAELIPPAHPEMRALADQTPETISLYAGVDFVSQYISRGLVYSSKASVQPWLEMDLLLLEDPGPTGGIGQVSWVVGNWNSFQEGDPGLGQPRTRGRAVVENWYEADVYTGPRVDLGEHLQTTFRLNWYTSPSDSFGDIYELDLRLVYDDSEFWTQRLDAPDFSLTPSLRIAKEIRDEGPGSAQWYVQPSLTPSFTLRGLPGEPTLMFPLAAGFGANGQYVTFDTGENRHFGFFLAGAGLQWPLDLGGSHTGPLTISAGLNVYVLSDEDLSFTGDQVELVGRLGIGYSF